MKVIKVVEVLTDRELAVNAGKADGLVVDDVLRILPSRPRPIVDPDTQELLGEVAHTKALVRVFDVQEKFALARTFRSIRVNVGGSGNMLSPVSKLFEPPRWETRYETLRKDPKAGAPIQASEAVVAVGDIAEVVDAADVEDLASNTIWR